MNDSKKDTIEDGLPEVADGQKQRNPLVLILVVALLALIIWWILYNRLDTKPQKPVEETYTIQSDSQAEVHNEQLVLDKGRSSASASNTQPSPELLTQQLALIQEKQKELQQRLSAPLMAVNVNPSSNASGLGQQAPVLAKDENAQILGQASTSSAETASILGPLNYVIAQGGLIHAVLESATDSDLPGFLRAIVSEPVYSEDGSQVLIPRGSRLVGQYKNGIMQGQSRIFIVWTRLLTPVGISLNLGSPGIDSLGVSGIGADEINRHFWERFSTASLLSLIGAGSSVIGVKDKEKENSISAYRESVAASFAQSANQSFRQDSLIASTLKTYQGKSIIVFVARDLNFQAALKMIKPKINVF